MAEPAPLQAAMTDGEAAVLRECFSKAASLVEFGCGGSTLLAVRSPSLRRIWSVESDPGWIERLRIEAEIAAAEQAGRLRLHCVDIGAVGEFGFPRDGSMQAAWPRYYQSVWDDPAALDTDLVLVDGRFRVACALEALARCRPHAVLLFHDFWNRTPYHPVLAFTDWLGSCDSLAILRRKPSFDSAAFEQVRQAYRLQPG
ncbi:class I SAM-dependent methyltransferase [Thermomonas aquatica]|uniref:Class I SAM-dependent methyltransferase n=1 Tax=Thermomonas aquatica TaxID=2202149 RepID=A0A5B7ZNA4_9GAMM|nr:class I SAM-dependent methyltransferase [Thermomonas aquatica]QDA55906.1 class I SAM-dependent methyltransferase [Thermomonas aquatica]